MEIRILLFIILVVMPFVLAFLYFLIQYTIVIWVARYFQKIAARYHLNYSQPSMFLYPSLAGKVAETGIHITISRKGLRRTIYVRLFKKSKVKKHHISIFNRKRLDSILQKTFI